MNTKEVIIPMGYVRVQNPDNATHVLDYDGSLVALPGDYSRSLRAWLKAEPQFASAGPRRNNILRSTPEELAIRDIVDRIEVLGAHIKLTDCITLLGQAREALADWVDEQ